MSSLISPQASPMIEKLAPVSISPLDAYRGRGNPTVKKHCSIRYNTKPIEETKKDINYVMLYMPCPERG
jgi:hypothetical protein